MPKEVTLRAVAASGEEAAYGFALDYDGPVWAELDVTSRVTGIPAVCYDDERVRPVIRIRTSAPDGLPYELAWEVERTSGERAGGVEARVAHQGWAHVQLAEIDAGRVERLTWSLRHRGVETSTGAVRFLREPFGILPDAVSGETLKAGGDFVVLVISRASRGDPVAGAGGAGTNGVVLLDGFMGSSKVREFESSNVGAFRVVDIQAFEQEKAASGMSLLLPLATLNTVMPASAVVVAPSLLGISREGGAQGFERRLSAMTGLLTGEASGRPRVVLVVPPVFDVLPGCGCLPGATPCVHAAEARSYAEAVMRVADVYGVETVDLFSAFQTAGGRAPLVENGGLTETGRAFALGLIEKKLEK